ncbi:uncharacterized protein K460DRAFT_361128 [Cucurbitaria berberidis CBS 394.84]|uniref:Uncharacterized protein n=1 Tax=Cucurbitaria berberidis CBS 394.84 TaxID=1168544 RepID=A0A9P4LCS3_9PLEO|nr:uncharacterized protein K460DRAFT_361128 [Cucurbitaria berberidis CBS 394.84]KAF1850310.1 hypothetical protein K460DRAFT_361128 [Cucurbitaria berberidis CBS 394.84]
MPGDKAEDADDTVVAAVEEVPSEKKKPRKRGKKGGKRAKKPAKVSQGGRSPLEKSSVALLFALLVFLGGAWIFV